MDQRKAQLIAVVTLALASCTQEAGPPKLSDYATFAFYAGSGEMVVYAGGGVKERTNLSDLQDGALKFRVTGPTTGLIFGNQGSGEVEVFKSPASISFIETTGSGTKHVFTVHEEWQRGKGGFRATYVRNVENTLATPPEIMRSTYEGWARIE